MNVDQGLINFLLIVVSSVLGWFARELWSAVKQLKEDLAKLRVELANDYTRKDDFHDAMRETRTDMKEGFREIKEMLGTLFDRIDKKVDK